MAINSLYSDETQKFMKSLGMASPYQMKPNIALEGPALGKGKSASEMSDVERMAQLMQGNLAGQLDTGDKLTALSALLRSVSRGRTQTPDQVFRAIQQQKLQEVQGRIQLAEMQKQAKQAAEMQKYRQQLIDAETDPRRKAYLQVADADTINKIIQEQFKPQQAGSPTSAEREALSLGLKPGTDAWNEYLTQSYSKTQFITTPQGTASVPGMGLDYKEYIDPKDGLTKKAVKIGEKWFTI